MQPIDLVAWKALEEPICDHSPRATQALLSGLEDEDGSTVEVARFGEVARRPEHHGGVSIVPTGVHTARVL